MHIFGLLLWALALWSIVVAWAASTDGPFWLLVLITPFGTSALIVVFIGILEAAHWLHVRRRLRRICRAESATDRLPT